jgi:uncharacterized delta-60 repeat protein
MPYLFEALESRRLLSAGQPDPTFGTLGRTIDGLGVVGAVQRVAMQSDGEIVVATAAPAGVRVLRYNPDGSSDTTFGTAGRAGLPAASKITDLRILSDGRIELAASGAYVARLLPTGKLDPTLNPSGATPGIEVLDAGDLVGNADFSIVPNVAAIEPDGKFVIAGNSSIDDPILGAPSHFRLGRLNLDGTPDATFAPSRATERTSSNQNIATSMVVLADGSIVAGGNGVGHSGNSASTFLYAFDASGTPTRQWSGFDISSFLADLRVWANGQVLGTFTFGSPAITTTPPPTFRLFSGDLKTSSALTLAKPLVAANETASLIPMTFGPSGEIYAGGSINTNQNGTTTSDFLVARYDAQGKFDPTYGTGGVTRVSFATGQQHRVEAMTLDANGRLVAVGRSDSALPALARFTSGASEGGGGGGGGGGGTGGGGAGGGGAGGTGGGGNVGGGGTPAGGTPAVFLAGVPSVGNRDRSVFLTLTFTDDAGIDLTTLGNKDIRITGAGKHGTRTGKLVTVSGSGSAVSATYVFKGRHGRWSPADNGTYTIQLPAKKVADKSGNFIPATTVGSFDVNIPTAARARKAKLFR